MPVAFQEIPLQPSHSGDIQSFWGYQGANSDLGCFVVEENQKNPGGHATALSYQTSKCGYEHLVCLKFALESSGYH
jgi:hypothetical protein